MYRKESQVSKGAVETAGSSAKIVELESLGGKFREFAEVASAFVREASQEGRLSPRSDERSVEDNLSITKRVFSKWSIEIIMSTYSLKSLGFGELKRLLNGISSRVLSKKLKDLEEMGFLDRTVIESRPPRVKYTLSEKGELLAKLGEPVILYLRQSIR